MKQSEFGDGVGAKLYLEFAVHLLDFGIFNPIVFSHENQWFDFKRYANVVLGFTNLLSFLYSCGITMEIELLNPTDLELELYRNIMKEEQQLSLIKYYQLFEIDYLGLNFDEPCLPDNCEAEDFFLVKIFLLLKAGASLNKRSLEHLLERKLTDSETITIRKQLENIIGKELIKRGDNSYEMR